MFVVNNALELLTPELTLWREVILEVRRYVLDAVQELRSAEHSLHQAAQSVELGRKEALVARIAVLKRNIAEQGHKLIELHEGLGREIIDHGGDPRFAGFRDRTAVVVKAIKVSEQRLETLREQRRALDGKLLIAPRKLASITVATLVLLAVAIVWHRGGSGAAIALTRDQLPLASPYLEVTWETWRAGHWEGFSWVNVPNAAEAVAGSTGMVKVEGDRLYLITNRHVLDLAGVRAATTNTAQFAVLKYQATVTFPSHRERQILRFGCPESAVD